MPKAVPKKSVLQHIQRIKVGAFILSMFIVPIFMGVLYQTFYFMTMNVFCCSEILNVGRNSKRDKRTNVWIYQKVIVEVLMFTYLPVAHFNYKSLQQSGVTRFEYPVVYALLFDYHILLCTIGVSIWFIATTMKALSLKGNDLLYFMNSIGYAVCWAMTTTVIGPGLVFLAHKGRFWFFFPQLCIAWNDALAYFFGKSFGKRKLIGVSPSKTVEGFMGAFLSMPFQTYYFS